jgi:hypothetical protein
VFLVAGHQADQAGQVGVAQVRLSTGYRHGRKLRASSALEVKLA